jgi:hypothetical protein
VQEAGQTVIVGRRPLRGHGSAVIQLGVPIIEGPFEDENQRGMSSFYHRALSSYPHILMTSFVSSSRDKGGCCSWVAARPV